MSTTLEERIDKLEAIEAIKQLKMRYFYACDERDAVTVEQCFANTDVLIDAGFIGQYKSGKEFADVFKSMTQSPHHLDQHYGIAPEISLIDATHAKGRWRLHFQLLDSEKGVVQFMGGVYDDVYIKESSGKESAEWKIQRSSYRVSTNLMMTRNSANLLEVKEMGELHAIATELAE